MELVHHGARDDGRELSRPHSESFSYRRVADDHVEIPSDLVHKELGQAFLRIGHIRGLRLLSVRKNKKEKIVTEREKSSAGGDIARKKRKRTEVTKKKKK